MEFASNFSTNTSFEAPPFRIFSQRNLKDLDYIERLTEEQRFAVRVVAQVLPFRVNQYVVDNLIDWEQVPDDPIFRLVFPQPEMLAPEHFSQIAELLKADADKAKIRQAVEAIQLELNPHPAGQTTLNVPRVGNEIVEGAQHKYQETLLFFPSQGQTRSEERV